MHLSVPSFVLGLHVMHGVMASFQLPPFIETLSKSKPNGQGDRLFTMPPNVLNVARLHRFTPRKRHLKPQRLKRRMGSDFDPFWMSTGPPDDLLDTMVKQREDTSLSEDFRVLNFSALQQTLSDALARGEHGLDLDPEIGLSSNLSGSSNSSVLSRAEKEGGTKNSSRLDALAGVMVGTMQAWLVRQASCPVYYRWEDLGLLYWPRWVRRGMCSKEDSSSPSSSMSSSSSSSPSSSSSSSSPSSCSWPPGMHCVPAEAKRLKILRWQCRNNKAFNNFQRFRQSGRRKDLKRERPGRKRRHRRSEENVGKTLGRVRDSAPGNRNAEYLANAGKSETDSSKLLSLEDVDLIFNFKNPNRKGTIGKDPIKALHAMKDKSKSEDGNDTEKWSKSSWKERRRKLNLKCKWIKIPYPVTNDCFCSC